MTRAEKRERWKRRARRERIALILAVAALVTGTSAGAIRSEAEPAAAAIEAPQKQQRVDMAPDIPAHPEPSKGTEAAPSYYDIPLSHELQDQVFAAAEQYGVPPALVFAMMDQESDYRTDLVSTTNDYGIMQINRINHDTLRETLGVTDIMDPAQNIQCGVYMIGKALEKYDGDMTRALTAYNRGDTGARRYYEANGTYETEYSRSILETYAALVAAGEGGE